MKKSISIVIGSIFIFLGISFFWLDHSYSTPKQKSDDMIRVEILEGDNIWAVAKKLEDKKLIGSKWAFLFGVWRDGLRGTFRAGVYSVSESLSPADMAVIFSRGEAQLRDVKVTFPEGWTMRDMAKRLTEKGLSGEAFLAIAEHPSESLKTSFDFLSDLRETDSLEGYLFPDTYFFLPETTSEEIVLKMLKTFDMKTQFLQEESRQKNKNFSEQVIMASILEGEVRTSGDRKIVSGIFWNRIASGMRLQSDATLDYVLQSGKIQHNGKDLETDSPYNTYRYSGLPPGPVGNPSLDALDATLHPASSSYVYFLSDPQTGKTYFATTFEEHKMNKMKVGL